MFSGLKPSETEIYRRLIFLWERAFLNGAQAFQVSVQDGSVVQQEAMHNSNIIAFAAITDKSTRSRGASKVWRSQPI
jgi:hypothetical protein